MARSLLVISLVGVACSAGPGDASLRMTNDEGTTIELRVEVADSPQERATGLMGRDDLDPFDGMVFSWTEPTTATFWMKDTLIPLSIAFWDEQGRIVAIVDMEPCTADPCPSYDAGVAFTGAVEVEQGTFEAHGIEVGHRVELDGHGA